ncbi:MAG: DNA repair protein RadA [Candidatus Omnitrophota bacterium]
MATRTRTIFSCQGCSYQSPKWLGKCPDCGSWNSFVEEDYSNASIKSKERTSFYKDEPVLLKDVVIKDSFRIKTEIKEFDRVLGGGIVSGSVVLIGGDPGIGKSTISLQISNHVAQQGRTVLYISGEESVAQIKLRAKRLGAGLKDEVLYIVNQTDLSLIIEYIQKLKPDLVIIDSIQVVFDSRISSAAGSVSQVRECAGILTQIAKTTGTSIFIIGHVTKEGTIAGPRVLEHIVDTVLYFEGDRFAVYRILRAVKNRFGSTNEIGVFEMGQAGLKEVNNPSEIFLSERAKEATGSVVVPVMEGTRPLLVEIQALVSKTVFGYPLRRAQGFDYNRLALLAAVLEKRMGLALESQDIFVNVVGGIKIEDPAADLAVALAIASAFREKNISSDTIVLGEVGLAGEVRNASQVSLRINEAAKLGFKHCIIPKGNSKNLDYKKDAIEIVPVLTLKEAMDIALAPGL